MKRQPIAVERCGRETVGDWLRLRRALWPEVKERENQREALALLERGDGAAAFLARNRDREAVGFAEASLRSDYVNGCASTPVGFLEGVYVERSWRRQGVARRLCRAAEAWAREQGCAEFASDALIANRGSLRMHLALGFAETERVVYFRKRLRPTLRRSSGT